MKKGKGKGKDETYRPQPPFYPTYRQVCQPEYVNSIPHANSIIDTLIDNSMQIMKDREVKKRIPAYSTKHTLQSILLLFDGKREEKLDD